MSVEGSGRAERSALVRGLRAIPAVVAVGVAVIALAAIGIVATGRWWQPTLRSEAAAAATRDAPVAIDDTPAHAVLEQVLAADPAPVATDAAGTGQRRSTTRHTDLDRCDTTAPTLAAEQSAASGEHAPAAVAVEIYGAGLGQRVFDQRVLSAARCGAWTAGVPGPGAVAAEGAQSGQWWLLWRRGDVLIRVSGSPDDAGELRRHAEVLDGALQQALTPVCADPAAPADAAVRNPGQPDHRPFSTTEPVTPPDDVAAPDPGLLDRGLAAPDGDAVRAAATLTASPPPPPVPQADTVEIPGADTVGPGCGWAFTGMVAPIADPADLARQADEARRSATDALRQRWSTWPDDVAAWQRLRAAYLAMQRARATQPAAPDPATEPAPVTPSALADSPAPTTTTTPGRPSPSTTAPPPPTTQPAPTTTAPSPSTTVAAAAGPAPG